ncbi:MAG: SDR family oxidoreductase [Bacteriovoracaceae bacterium]|nr:SDR family oxidoreductase [Bacteriovoracaceae bacterium]
MTTLLTGASGFLGGKYLEIIKEQIDEEYILLLRDRSFDRLSVELEDYPHIHLVRGGLQHPDLFVETHDKSEIFEKLKLVDTVIHLAALYDFNATKERLYKNNVIGTQNVLFFSEYCPNIKKFIYASTIAISGDFEGPFSEDDFDLSQSFPNPYAKTKFEAEGLVRKWAKKNIGVQVDILRFGVIVGDSLTGKFDKSDGPYYFFKNIGNLLNKVPHLSLLNFVPFPFEGKAIFPLVPVDFAAKAIHEIGQLNHSGLKCFHIIAKNAPRMENFLEDFLREMGRPMKVVALPPIGPIKSFLGKSLRVFNIPEALVDYLYFKTKFINRYYDQEFGENSRADYASFNHVFFKEAIIKCVKGERR